MSAKERLQYINTSWKSHRLLTNADHPAVAMARAYLKCRGVSEIDCNECLADLVDSNDEDSMLTSSVVQTAADVLQQDSNLTFADQDNAQMDDYNEHDACVDSLIRADDNSAATRTVSPAMIAMAVYDYSSISESASQFGQLVGMREGRASLLPGDVIFLNNQWSQVVEVDLLWARVSTRSCDQPPACWLNESNEFTKLVWVPVSSLWAILTIRKFQDGNDKHSLLLSFVTPLPMASKSLGILTKLSEL